MNILGDNFGRKVGRPRPRWPHRFLRLWSERQRTASQDIQRLQKETEDLKQRLQQLENGEDRHQQARRLVCLIFSGPELQRQTCREDAARLIKAVVL